MSESEWQTPPKTTAFGWDYCVFLSPLTPTSARVHLNQRKTPRVLSHSAQKVGYFLKPVMAFFFHEKKVSPLPLGNFFLQFKKR